MVLFGHTHLCNTFNARIMVTVKIGCHEVELYDAIDELPIVRFHKYQKLLMIDSGIGSDIQGFDRRIEKARRYLMTGKNEQAQKELDNLRQCVFFIMNEVAPKHLAFAVLVSKIDGQPRNEMTDDALSKTLDMLNDAPAKDLTAQLEAVKKKIDAELTTYFPKLFNDSEVKEYFVLLRQRTMEVLRNIIAGVRDPNRTKRVDELTTELITYSNPQKYDGSDGAEIQFDRQFENLCILLGHELNVQPKEYTVLEFYNAFEYLQERNKKRQQARKRA